MRTLLGGSESLVWLALVSATGLSWLLSATYGLGPGSKPAIVTVLVLVIAFIKVRLVLRYFMEIRHAPMTLKLICDTWLLCAGAAVIGLYLFA